MKNYTNLAQQQVGEFQKTFGHPSPSEPTTLTLNRVVGRSSWGSGEEIVELIHASSSTEDEFKSAFVQLLQGLRKGFEKQKNKPLPKNEEERLIAQADAIADHLYFVLGDAVELGIDIGKVLTIVHEANMSKLFTDENGNKYVKYSPSGKVLKSPEFEAPEEKIKLEILRQVEESKKLKQSIKEKVNTTRKRKKVKIEESTDNEVIGDIGEEFIDTELVDKLNELPLTDTYMNMNLTESE